VSSTHRTGLEQSVADRRQQALHGLQQTNLSATFSCVAALGLAGHPPSADGAWWLP
jgi:hypothetical protein